MKPRLVLPMVVLLGCCLLVAAPTLAVGDEATGQEMSLSPDDIDADEVRMDIALEDDGSAQWTIEYWVQLDDADNEEAFESLREDIEDDPEGHTAEFESRIDDTVAAASEATGREMGTGDVAVETDRQSLTREYGVVRYTFEWQGFAALEDDEIHAGDAIEGLYIDDGTRLLISWPEGYERTAVSPEPDDTRDRAVIWHGGETDFVSGEPRVVVAPEGTSLSWLLIAGGLGGLLVLGGGGVWWLRGRSPADGADSSEGGPAPSSTTASATETAAATATADDGANASRATPADPDVDPDLLSNDEQVIRILEANGGRVKQQTVKEELDWTDAKTSKVVGSLREEGMVESFRIGRENVLTFADEDPLDLENRQP